MTPDVTRDNIWHLAEISDENGFCYTALAHFDEDDHAFFGKLPTRSRQSTWEDMASALQPIPDEVIFPRLPPELHSALCSDEYNDAPAENLGHLYIKRPKLGMYAEYEELEIVSTYPSTLLHEAEILDRLARHPHPSIIKFHGCRTRRGLITGLVLDKHEEDLKERWGTHRRVPDKERVMADLESAVQHLHSLGVAHNDINPANIVMDGERPVIIDFGSARTIGEKLKGCLGTAGWEEEDDDYKLSKASHDLTALEKVREWLDDPDSHKI